MRSLKEKNLIIENRSLIARLASFMLPIILFLIATRYGTPKFNECYTRGLHIEEEKLKALGDLLASSTSFIRISGIREILASTLEPFCLLALLLGGSFNVLFTGYLIKLGLTGLVMYMLLNKSICVDKMASVILSMIYALVPTAILCAQIPTLQNFLVLMPLVALLQDRYLAIGGVKKFVILAVTEGLLFVSGVYGFVTGIPFAIAIGLLLVMCRSNTAKAFLSKFGGIILATLLGAVLSAVVNVPRIYLSPVNDLEGGWEPRYKVYDFLVGLIDGKSPVTAFSTGVVPLTLGVFVLFLIVMAFVNPFIPFKIKVYAIVISVICHVTLAFPVLTKVANVYDGTSITASRYLAWAFILIFIASISYKNIPTLSTGNIYLGIFILLAIVLLSDLSVTETSPTKFSLFFTTVTIIVTGSIVIKIINKDLSYRYIVCLIAFIEIFVNLLVVSPKAVSGFQDLTDYNSGIVSESSGYDFSEMGLDIFGSDYRYLLLSSDIGKYQMQSIPDGVNALSTAALLSSIMTPVSTETIYSGGFLGNESMYTIKDEGQQCELILRLYYPEGGEYYLYSGIEGKVYITESDEMDDRLTVYERPSVHRVTSTSEYVNLRVAVTPDHDQRAYVSVWQMDTAARDSFNGSTNEFDGNTIKGGDFRWVLSHNANKSLITSIEYSPMLEVVVDGKRANTFSYLGRLGATLDINSAGVMPDITIRAYTSDILVGSLITLSGIATIVTMIYINNKIINKRNGRE